MNRAFAALIASTLALSLTFGLWNGVRVQQLEADRGKLDAIEAAIWSHLDACDDWRHAMRDAFEPRRCEWAFIPSKDRAAIAETLAILGSRREETRIAWLLSEAP